ncbi:MAG TPA: TraB/GumN family protein [Sphingobium sp.]|nr:TraB/GumN family protein [Sphingobium sp.]
MPFLTRLTIALAAFLLLTSPGFAPIGARTVNRGVDAHPALWVVRDADTTIYLFGTIHVLRPEIRWFDGPVKRAFDTSDTLVLEVLTPDKSEVAALTARLAIDPDGPPLTQKLDPAVRGRYLALIRQLNLAREQFEPFQPWFAAMSLSILPLERLGYSADSGVEEVLRRRASRDGKAQTAFETVSDQLGFFAGLPEKTQIAFLSATIDDAAKVETEIGKMVHNWSAGRPDALAAELNESLKDMPDLAQALLYDRNKRWAQWIAARMAKPGTVFIAVGAGHLAGKGSVLDELGGLHLAAQRADGR